jgi:hypothetical protein
MAQNKSKNDQNQKPTKANTDFSEIVKAMANTPLISNADIVKRSKKRKHSRLLIYVAFD